MEMSLDVNAPGLLCNLRGEHMWNHIRCLRTGRGKHHGRLILTLPARSAQTRPIGTMAIPDLQPDALDAAAVRISYLQPLMCLVETFTNCVYEVHIPNEARRACIYMSSDEESLLWARVAQLDGNR
ncbi:uncharacterized protein CIMG_12259 [Coccidioides immitis RS]|uniref:Uncharacterized protein n=4 Tax=Coccidioides immitis TaxID=5501 RepID=A0A0D8JYH1_COCIM|nr:uncharacterized protein CIMG_12259 [Coccidioides immitis RS]KJF61303.1 hypothetical protein CIMG_12259 [Coccidioides immitis RS]KMP08577.1 hypothetical protein CIRG_08258 [Coccidioides immitis RMSCC 2394]KMU78578.1 hypothetical protein CISG_01618 [Coccidioides immitis RMSCC 3703]KMU87392.1 hypothetical protein CIHG_05186 [Coccidioides immitis H538.4]